MLVLFVVFFPPAEIKSAVTFVRVLSDFAFPSEDLKDEKEKKKRGSVNCLQQIKGGLVLRLQCSRSVLYAPSWE